MSNKYLLSTYYVLDAELNDGVQIDEHRLGRGRSICDHGCRKISEENQPLQGLVALTTELLSCV